MREIKFRYWNKTNNIMVFEPSIRSDYQFSLNEYLGDDRGWVWMQYTGLKDKNGKEIYEDDIVTYIRHDKPIRATVEWDNGCYYLRNHKDHVDSDTMNKDSMFFIGAERMQVIGNIYENPDPLSTSQE